MCISTQSGSHLNPIQALRFTCLLCLSWILPQSGSWYLHLAYIQVTSHLHPGPQNCILVPSKHHLKPIQVSRCVSHLHPGPFSTGELYLSSILVPYHPIHVSRCAYKLNPGPISIPCRSRDLCLLSTQAPRFTFLLCLSWILPQSGSWYLHLTYIQVTSHLHPGPQNCISSIQASSQTHTCFNMCVSPPSRSFLNWRIVYQLHTRPISPHPHLKMCISAQPGPISTPSRSRDLCLLSTQAPRFTFLLCLSWISPQSGSWYLHLALIQVTSRLHPGPPNCILVPSKHHLKPIQVSFKMCVSPPSRSFLNWRVVSQLHPSPISPYPRLKMCISTQSRSHLNPMQV